MQYSMPCYAKVRVKYMQPAKRLQKKIRERKINSHVPSRSGVSLPILRLKDIDCFRDKPLEERLLDAIDAGE